MGETITLRGADGFEFSAYHEQPFTPRKGGVIVIQEIFGIDRHVRADVERWAKAGYEAIAPSLYDRRERGFTAGHDPEGLTASADVSPLYNQEKTARTDRAACWVSLSAAHRPPTATARFVRVRIFGRRLLFCRCEYRFGLFGLCFPGFRFRRYKI